MAKCKPKPKSKPVAKPVKPASKSTRKQKRGPLPPGTLGTPPTGGAPNGPMGGGAGSF